VGVLWFLSASIVKSYDILLRVPAEVHVEGAHQAAHSH